MFYRDPTGLPALAALWIGFLAFVVAVIVARRGHPRDAAERAARRSGRSIAGVAIQMAAFFLASFGPPRVALDPLSPAALALAALVLALWLGATGLFVASTRAMGRNWSVVARTRSDHELVQSGPFARIRHPIYTAIALELVGMAIALGFVRTLILGLPLYALGTWLRIAEEERMLRAMFGASYEAYAARVRRFVPGLF